ncbi:hypothetical protein K505DRAFT_141314 [Melanomma pulvis-pyrius CBS 109.77]|uniref:Uncharacterized protein n=1 Tax=Melanomma pulvis-pyrius CBS 109.77 TaxID=1314802 RepID=A0A6A6WRU7_9PLEO|nr:hypothetical protein K505DRAFT_141314 [Melanomma pulvis-pyrius CBS 109.77]
MWMMDGIASCGKTARYWGLNYTLIAHRHNNVISNKPPFFLCRCSLVPQPPLFTCCTTTVASLSHRHRCSRVPQSPLSTFVCLTVTSSTSTVLRLFHTRRSSLVAQLPPFFILPAATILRSFHTTVVHQSHNHHHSTRQVENPFPPSPLPLPPKERIPSQVHIH